MVKRVLLGTGLMLVAVTPVGVSVAASRQAVIGQLASPHAATSGAAAKKPIHPSRLLVRFRKLHRGRGERPQHVALGSSVVRRYRRVPGLELVTLPPGKTVDQAIGHYRADSEVVYAEPDYQVGLDAVPNDPQWSELWGMHNTGQTLGLPDADIDAPEAWDVTTGSATVVVGVIDTGIDYTHPDLVANVYRNEVDCDGDGEDDDGNGWVDDCYGIDTVNRDGDPRDDHGHGTHVAGTLGAVGNNGIGVAGVSWNVGIMSCKFLGYAGLGYIADAIDCLEYFSDMRQRGVEVVVTNNSWGGGGFSAAFFDALEVHLQQGILFAAAAGNSAVDADVNAHFPASNYLPNVIAVAATDHEDGLAWFSNLGRRSVHLGAPGLDVFSTERGGGYGLKSGTSMATPHVAGVAALLYADDPSRDWITIKNLLLAGTDPLASLSSTVAQGRLNAHGALTCQDREILSRLRPLHDTSVGLVGLPVAFSFLHIDCADPAGAIVGSINPGGGSITLLDDGLGFDQVAGDGIYSAEWVPSWIGTFEVSFPDGEPVTITVGEGDVIFGPTPSEGDQFGWTLAPFDGDYLVSAPRAGAAHRFDGTTNAHVQSYATPVLNDAPFWGGAMTQLGSSVVLGSPFADVTGIDEGLAQRFDAATAQLLETYLNPTPNLPGQPTGDLFGWALASVGANLAISAMLDVASGSSVGEVYLFDGGTGSLLHTFNYQGFGAGTLFGSGLTSDGTDLIINDFMRPEALRFDADPTSGTFGAVLQRYVSPDLIGVVVTGVPGNRLLMGAWQGAAFCFFPECLPVNFGEDSEVGKVHVFDEATGAYLESILDPFPSRPSLFGYSVALAGDKIVVGAPDFYFGGSAAYLYDADTLELLELLESPVPDRGGGFGTSVLGVGADVMVGAPFEDHLGLRDVGVAYRFTPTPQRERFKCYKARRAQGAPRFELVDVTLDDAFDSKVVTVRTTTQVCNAVDQDGLGTVDPGAHLTCFRTKDVAGQPKFTPQQTVSIVNRIGTQELILKKASDLCVPSGHDGDPISNGLGSYRCYKAKVVPGTPRFGKRDTNLVDDFDAKPGTMLKLSRFCTPADRDATGVPVPDYDLTCYRMRDSRDVAKFGGRLVAATNAFGTQELFAKRASEVCVPTKRVAAP